MRSIAQLLLVIALCAPLSAVRADDVQADSEQDATAEAVEATPTGKPTPLERDITPPAPKPLWLEAEIGVASMKMSEVAFGYGGWGSKLVPPKDDGLALQVAAGGRWRWLSFGARATTSRYSAYAINVVGGEVGVHWPVRWLEPRIQLHGGYAWHGDSDLDLESPGLAGPAFGGGAGLRMPLGEWFVVGLSFDMDLMFFTGKIRLAEEGPGIDARTNAVYQWMVDTGQLGPEYSGKGWQLRTMVSLGLQAW